MRQTSDPSHASASPRENQEEDAKPALVPKLRFPEFRGAGEWTTETLGTVAKISTEKVGDKACIPMSITSGIGLVSQMEKFGRIIAGSSYENYLQLQKNDFAYNKSATKEYPEGFIALYSGDDIAAVPNSIFTCFRVIGDSPIPQYLKYLFLGNLHGRWLRKFIEVGARAHGSLSINEDDLLALPVPLPLGKTSVQEQQKIAECLSSLDELMAAQARKVEAVKEHKKGLMQQLFPREGETQPRFRFPEFRDEGEWEVKPLGKVADNLDNRRVPITSSERKAGNTPYYGASGIVDYVEGFIFDEDLLCVSEDGANLVARTYPIAFSISGKTWVNNHAHVLKFENTCTQKVVELYLNAIKLDDFITGMAQPKLNKAMLDRIPIPHPRLPEQQCIATCLSSLDAMITAETQKHEALRTHKRGLMQQLFPTPESNDSASAPSQAPQP
jgi:type I restriction enzyme S subunit